MARLFEYQAKKLLKENGILIPDGEVFISLSKIKKQKSFPLVIKAQAWVTGRAAVGGIKFASNQRELLTGAKNILGKELKGITIDKILIEKKLNIKKEFFAGIIIDDNRCCPMVVFSSQGGSGVEEIAKKYPDKISFLPVDIYWGLRDFEARNLVRKTGISGKLQNDLASVLVKLYKIAKRYEARSLEVNPLVLSQEGEIIACDCHLVIDDAAVFRHPELGIEIAREFDHPPTELDKIAYQVEKNDYRGTFYFIQLEKNFKKGDRYLGFHGAGGGGSMMSMNALFQKGYKIANFCDTSGNPPASKVYRAARIILSQKNIDGYFGSGSGVASQEQFHSARGLVKAFQEEEIKIPVVVRLGGNQEEKAIQILTQYTKNLSVPVECYGKNDSANFCVERIDSLIKNLGKFRQDPSPTAQDDKTDKKRKPHKKSYSFKTVTGGVVSFDYSKCRGCQSKVCIKECVPQILELRNDTPVLKISKEEAEKGKCSECLACEIECLYGGGNGGGRIILPIVGLEEYLRK